MKRYFAFMALVISSIANATDTNPIYGKYIYSAYKTTLKNGNALSLSQLGASAASIEFLPSKIARMEMKMLNGSINLSEAKIIEVHISGQGGYIVEKWPEMSYPVKLEFHIQGSELTYVIRFTDPSDTMRYGAKEEATLTKITVH